MSTHFGEFVSAVIAATVVLVCCISTRSVAQDIKDPAMTPNKLTVQAYMDAFTNTDHAAILSCLTDDVEWFIPGMFRTTGKPEFDKRIESDAFVGHPVIKVTRMTEEHDVVVAEGTVRANKRDGGVVNLVFCDVFEMRGNRIKRLISYLMEITDKRPK